MPDSNRHDALEGPPPPTVAQLERRLLRERAVRREAEEISERATRNLYEHQQRLTLLGLVAKAANEATDLPSVLRVALEAVRGHCGWSVGHTWIVEPDGVVSATDVWAGDIDRFQALRIASRDTRMDAETGLPGMVIASSEPVWIRDFSVVPSMPRMQAAAAVGLHTAMGFPILTGDKVVGVLEFFSERVEELDPQLLDLLAQVGTEVGRVAERQRAAARLLHQATHDVLTGLPNRVLIREKLDRMLAGAEGSASHSSAVFFVDLDGFKAVNDSLGHAAGDRVLRDVAERLSFVVRPSDTLGRLSGDEFIVLCDSLSPDHSIEVVAEQIATALRQPFEFEGELFQVSASVGITDLTIHRDPEELIAEADAAMYQAKQRGRGQYQIYTDALGEMLRKRSELERSLRKAPERDELELHYQPLLELVDRRIVGVEALLRWSRPEGMVMPMDFIPLAEETGLIVPIGAWVLDAAVRQMTEWHADASLASPPWMSVNLSVRQLADPDLIERVAATIVEHGADPSKLLLEVTESVILDDVEAGLTVLTELNRLGTEIAIDDFGTGYASLSYLSQFPAHTLKIDRSFISEMDQPRTRAIIASMIELAHALGLSAVAEGIETREQHATLVALGCDLGQGFLFARPMPAAEIEPLLRAGTTSITQPA